MTEELRLWAISQSGEAEPLSEVLQMPTEWEFEQLLVQNPGMLGTRIELVGRQTPTQKGPLDLLAVDQNGRLVVFELKRGTLAREAITQVIDYASALDAMSIKELVAHITKRSGHDGIQELRDFEQWYADKFGPDDISRLLPPRMVLVGLGVDPVAERMARFISGGSVDLSVVSFHGFAHGQEKVLARQLEVDSDSREQSRHRSPNSEEKRRALREYLTDNDYVDLFDRIHADIRGLLPEKGVFEHPGSKGIGFTLPDPDNSQSYKHYFGVQAGYKNTPCSVSILQKAIDWGGEAALNQLESSIELREWPYGGRFCAFQSERDWSESRTAVLEFVRSVMTNRSNAVVE